ncbi:MAG: endonuclease/exonuclease/phosphatase family protein [Candidatus Saccharibacteria bacterium]
MNIMYSNISGGLIFAGDTYGEMLFSKVSVEQYADYFKGKDLDILSLSEVHLEDKTDSEMVERLAHELGFEHHASLALSESHLDTSKKLGMAVLSRYPIIDQEEFIIPSPKLEVDRPNGDHWVMFDKGGQRVYIDVDGTTMALVNFSYFPFHHFKRSVDEPEFAKLRTQLVDVLVQNSKNAPTIITGDFNNKGHDVRVAFSELFAGGALEQAVTVPSTVIGYDEQLDHILYQPGVFTAHGGFAELNGSDHLAISAELRFTDH